MHTKNLTAWIGESDWSSVTDGEILWNRLDKEQNKKATPGNRIVKINANCFPPCVHLCFHLSVNRGIFFLGFMSETGLAKQTLDRFLCHPAFYRPVHPGHSVLLPGWDGPAPQGVDASWQGGWLPGLVPVPGPHLLAPAHDGCRAAGVGGAQSQSELLPHDCLPGGVNMWFLSHLMF